MHAEQFTDFLHAAVHELTRLNKSCDEEFHINLWPRWDYDLNRGTLTFSHEGMPKVIAAIEVVGSTSTTSRTWLWSWANENLPKNVTSAAEKVRAFGEAEGLTALTTAKSADDEFLGWEMTAIAAKVLKAKGAYRCPTENGFLYVAYSSLRFAGDDAAGDAEPRHTKCANHGSGYETFVCEHLFFNPAQQWFSEPPDAKNQWPDAWCATCNAFFEQEGEWNDKNESSTKIKLLCHHCYEQLRSQAHWAEGRTF